MTNTEKIDQLSNKNNTVLITGATSGIGYATALELAKKGKQKLILCGRRNDRLQNLCNHINQQTESFAFPSSFNIMNFEACQTAINALPNELKTIDVLINNAGLAKGLSEIHEGQLSHWEQMIDTNIKGMLYMSKLVTPGMVSRQKGTIINIGSVAGKDAYPMGNVYNATKFAVDGLTKAMRMDLFKYNIKVASVSPGQVEDTEFALVRYDGDQNKADIYKKFQPLKAIDIAKIILFILDQEPHVNISDIFVMPTHQASATIVHHAGR